MGIIFLKINISSKFIILRFLPSIIITGVLYDLYFAFSLEKLELFGRKSSEIYKDIKGDDSLESLYTQLFNIHGLILTKRV